MHKGRAGILSHRFLAAFKGSSPCGLCSTLLLAPVSPPRPPPLLHLHWPIPPDNLRIDDISGLLSGSVLQESLHHSDSCYIQLVDVWMHALYGCASEISSGAAEHLAALYGQGVFDVIKWYTS